MINHLSAKAVLLVFLAGLFSVYIYNITSSALRPILTSLSVNNASNHLKDCINYTSTLGNTSHLVKRLERLTMSQLLTVMSSAIISLIWRLTLLSILMKDLFSAITMARDLHRRVPWHATFALFIDFNAITVTRDLWKSVQWYATFAMFIPMKDHFSAITVARDLHGRIVWHTTFTLFILVKDHFSAITVTRDLWKSVQWYTTFALFILMKDHFSAITVARDLN